MLENKVKMSKDVSKMNEIEIDLEIKCLNKNETNEF
jgi:hypothetical protein